MLQPLVADHHHRRRSIPTTTPTDSSSTPTTAPLCSNRLQAPHCFISLSHRTHLTASSLPLREVPSRSPDHPSTIRLSLTSASIHLRSTPLSDSLHLMIPRSSSTHRPPSSSITTTSPIAPTPQHLYVRETTSILTDILPPTASFHR